MLKDSLKTAIKQIVDTQYNETKAPITGALLAEKLRSVGQDYKEAGYSKLAEPINELVQCNELSRNCRVKHMEVAPPSYEFGVTATATKPLIESYVRGDAWPVFAMLNLNSIAVFDQEESRFQLIGRDAVIRESQIRVNTPSNDEHRDWINQFATKMGVSIDTMIFEPTTILRDFSIWIQSQPSPAPHAWKGFRASKVAEAIRKWCDENGVDSSLFLTQVIPGLGKKTTSSPSEPPEENVRRALLKCISDLTIEDIEGIKLQLTVGVLLKYFKPRG